VIHSNHALDGDSATWARVRPNVGRYKFGQRFFPRNGLEATFVRSERLA
jgi:hypothetical protein